MGNVFSWEYISPVFYPKVDLYDPKVNRSNPSNWVIPPKVISPEGRTYTLKQINEELEPLEFGNKKQLELLAVLSEFEDALREGDESHVGLMAA